MTVFQSLLVCGGNREERAAKIAEIGESLGAGKFENNPDIFTALPTDAGNIGIEAVRELIAFLTTKPVVGEWKIVLIEEAEYLTEEAQNALLKTLEEPPEKAVIILSAANPDNLLPTVISRCQMIELAEKTQVALTEEEAGEQIREMGKIGEMDLGEKFRLAQKVASERQAAVAWIDKTLAAIHRVLTTRQRPPLWKKVRRLLKAKEYLKANTNVRLTIENLFLNW